MKGFLAGVGAATVLFALTSFAYWSGRSEAAAAAAPAAARTGGVVLRDLPLYRGFQAVVPLTPLPSGAVEMSTVFPPTLGAAITQMSLRSLGEVAASVEIRIDGGVVAERSHNTVSGATGLAPLADFVFDPPVVVPPGHSFGIRLSGLTSQLTSCSASIGGWVLFPGDV